MLDTSFSPWPSFTQEEVDAVRRVLLSNRVNYWTGQECRSFEQEFAAWAGCGYAVALANGTVALEAALKALGIGPSAGYRKKDSTGFENIGRYRGVPGRSRKATSD